MSTWQLQEAKSKFSQVVDDALLHGPQIVTRRGVDSVVIISIDHFSKLTQKKTSLLDALMSMPKGELDLQRKKDRIREIEF